MPPVQGLEEKRDSSECGLYHLTPGEASTRQVLQHLRQQSRAVGRALVFGHQGKSRHTGVWALQALLDSNSQLTELGPERTRDDFVLPQGGVEQGLCGKLVRIFIPELSECNPSP